MDLALIVDASSWELDFNSIREGIANFVNSIYSILCFQDEVRFALVHYGKTAVVQFDFTKRFSNTAQIVSEIKRLQQRQGDYEPDLSIALRLAQSSVFNRARIGFPKAIVIFSHFGLYGKKPNVVSSASELKQIGYTIGVWAWNNAFTNQRELDQVASSTALIIAANAFSELQRQSSQFTTQLKSAIGIVPGPGPGTTPGPIPGPIPGPGPGPSTSKCWTVCIHTA